MFSLGAGLYQEYFSPIQVNVLIVGVQGSGKTTVLERLKVTEFSSKVIAGSSLTEALRSKIFTRNNRDDYKPPPRRRRRPEMRPPSRFAWVCPPPPKYVMKSLAGLSAAGTMDGNHNLSNRNLRPSDIIFLDDDEDEDANLIKSQRAFRRGASSVHPNGTATTTTSHSLEELADEEEDEDEVLEFDVQAGKHMLALEKIRPTIGMNLAKLNIAKAKVNVWDLGGRLVDLWERYYNDADAVLYVWKLSAEEDVLEVQRSTFETVRASVECPILVLGHLMQTQPPVHCEPDVLYSTDIGGNTTMLQFANATTGEGIKSAVEGLVVRAMQARANP